MKYVIATLLIFLSLTSCADTKTENHNIQSCHCDQCMDVKIGQLIVAGFKGTEPSDYITNCIKKYHIGGVIYFNADVSAEMGERNIKSPEQVRNLSRALQSMSTHAPLFIAIDQEGGRVSRLRQKYGFPATVSAAYQGKVGNLDTTRMYAAQTADMLVGCGINVNFAPCVDIAINPNNPIIALLERAFSANADSVTVHASVWVEQANQKKILTSLKHFPGHGSSTTDSHLGLVDITKTWSERELKLYQDLIAKGYQDFVMIGHVINQNVDTLPASLSKATITGLLREKLGFQGVVITDDMNMGAIVDYYSFDKAVCLALNAGVDMIILGNNAKVYEDNLAPKCHDIIKRAVADGKIEQQRIDQAYAKIIKLKERL